MALLQGPSSGVCRVQLSLDSVRVGALVVSPRSLLGQSYLGLQKADRTREQRRMEEGPSSRKCGLHLEASFHLERDRICSEKKHSVSHHQLRTFCMRNLKKKNLTDEILKCTTSVFYYKF